MMHCGVDAAKILPVCSNLGYCVWKQNCCCQTLWICGLHYTQWTKMQERAPIYRDALREEHRDAARSNNVNTISLVFQLKVLVLI